jgi:hypothetical protein
MNVTIDEQAEFGLEIKGVENDFISLRRDALARDWAQLRASWSQISSIYEDVLDYDLVADVDEMLDPDSGYGADSLIAHIVNSPDWPADARQYGAAVKKCDAWYERLCKHQPAEHQFAREEARAYRQCLNKHTKGKEARWKH